MARRLGFRSGAVRVPKPLRGWITLVVLAGSAVACDTGREEPSSGGEADAAGLDGRVGAETSVQPDAGNFSGPDANSARSGAAVEQAAGVQIAAFSVEEAPDITDLQGRLPGPGDSAMYVPLTTLHPGTARIDPGIVNPYSGDPEAVEAGRRHFNAFNCSGCHAPLGGGGMGPPLTDDNWIFGDNPAAWYLVIMHGAPEGMPAFGSMLPRRTAWELVAYIDTLRDIDNAAVELGFDAEHALSPILPSRQRSWEVNERTPNTQR